MPKAAEASAPELTVLSPKPLQVIQRDTRASGRVLVSGRVTGACDAVEVRFIGRSLDGDLPGEWQPAGYSAAGQSFFARVRVPAGGWYTVEVRASLGGRPLGRPVTVDRVGVGEVFVIAGQSNSTNTGESPVRQASGMVASFGGAGWRVADDPQPGTHDRSVGGSPWPAFGDAMHAKYDVPIGIASTGHGGTSTAQWDPAPPLAEGSLFMWTMHRVHQLGPGGFRALLWHQGESDVQTSTDDHVRRLTGIITESKRQAGWEFPWFVAKVSYHGPHLPRHDNVRAAHQRVWDAGVALPGPDTDTLAGDHRDLGGTGVHFSVKGLKAHGEMWAEAVAPHLDRVLAADERPR